MGVGNMNKIWISAILIMSLMGFASALDGSGEAYGIDSIYSQYYSIYNGPATAKHIEAPQQYAIGVTPTTLYLGSQMQAMPYPQYYTTYTGGNSLWIQGSTSWTQYAKVPQGSVMSLLALSPTKGEGSLYETYPDGKVIRSNYYFYPVSRIGFYADTPGRHVLSFVLAGQPSSQVVIDVVSTYKPTIYQTPPAYYASYYSWNWDYYPHYWDYYPSYWDKDRRDTHPAPKPAPSEGPGLGPTKIPGAQPTPSNTDTSKCPDGLTRKCTGDCSRYTTGTWWFYNPKDGYWYPCYRESVLIYNSMTSK
jgi:hypothetical protein